MSEMYFQGPGFHLQVPTDWFVTSNPQVQVMFVAPPRDGARANLMITLRPLEASATLDEVVKSTLETQKKEYPEFSLIEDAEIYKGEVVGHQHLYRWYNETHKTRILQRQVIMVANQMLTSITTTRPDTDNMDDLDAALAAMIESFQFD